MKIKSVEIKNFRCLRHVEIEFDSVTTLIGPNGAGKSSVLRALDWFFNGDKSSLSEDDVYHGASLTEWTIEVKVVFGDLTEVDRQTLGAKYAPVGAESFTAWRTWEAGEDKFTGKAMAFPPFELVRAAEGATAKKETLRTAIDKYPDLALPVWSSAATTASAMDAWERENPSHLEAAIVSDTHFFGFHSQRKLSGVFDYVLVSADLRANEEAADHRGAIIGRILERAVDRSAADAAFEQLARSVGEQLTEISKEHLSEQLDDVAKSLSEEMQQFAAGRAVKLASESPAIRPQASKVQVSILDDAVETAVDRQGHGFQRTLMISSLKVLASRGAKNSDQSAMFLAIEEPELYQHPAQARLFASALRQITQQPGSGGVQIGYATHSPYFIEPRYFDQVRRVSRIAQPGMTVPDVRVDHATMSHVCDRLEGFTPKTAIRSRWDQVCLQDLSEAFFADVVVLVEGDNDKGILDGLAARDRAFEYDSIVVACAQGKEGLYVPHAILTELGIPTVAVFDNDSGSPERKRSRGKDEIKAEVDAEQLDRENRRINRRLCRYFGQAEVDYPVGMLADNVAVFDDRLEGQLALDWPDWETARDKLAVSGRGATGKNSATYRLAAEESASSPTGLLMEIVSNARALARGIKSRSGSI